MSLFSTPSQLVAASPVAKKCSIKQPVGTGILQNDPSQFDYRAKERCRSVALFQTTWITICRKVIMEFLPNDTKKKLPTPILTGIMHIHMYKRRRLKDQNSCLSLLSWSLFFDLTVRSHTIWTTSKYNHTGLSIQLYDVVRCVSPESSCSCLRISFSCGLVRPLDFASRCLATWTRPVGSKTSHLKAHVISDKAYFYVFKRGNSWLHVPHFLELILIFSLWETETCKTPTY